MAILYSCVQCAVDAMGEDRVRVVEHGDQLIIAVADGAGGLGGGAAAAEVVISMATTGLVDPRQSHDPGFWVMRLLEIDAALATAGGGQAAAVVASVLQDEIVGAAVGDAVAWLVSPSGIEDLTAHAVRKPLLGDGTVTPRAFGPARIGLSTLLLATDGLWKYAPRSTVCERVLYALIPGPCTELVNAVRMRSGELQDDVGAVLVRSKLPPTDR